MSDNHGCYLISAFMFIFFSVVFFLAQYRSTQDIFDKHIKNNCLVKDAGLEKCGVHKSEANHMEQCYKIEWLVEHETKTSIGDTTIVERHWVKYYGFDDDKLLSRFNKYEIGQIYPCYNSIYDLAEVAWHIPNLRGHNFWMTCGSILLLLSACLMLIYCVKINRSEINNYNDRNTQYNAAPVIISRWADDLPVGPRQPTLAELKEQADKLLAEFRSAQKQF